MMMYKFLDVGTYETIELFKFAHYEFNIYLFKKKKRK